jgi:hypothetical protein
MKATKRKQTVTFNASDFGVEPKLMKEIASYLKTNPGVTVSRLQRHFSIGYEKATKIVKHFIGSSRPDQTKTEEKQAPTPKPKSTGALRLAAVKTAKEHVKFYGAYKTAMKDYVKGLPLLTPDRFWELLEFFFTIVSPLYSNRKLSMNDVAYEFLRVCSVGDWPPELSPRERFTLDEGLRFVSTYRSMTSKIYFDLGNRTDRAEVDFDMTPDALLDFSDAIILAGREVYDGIMKGSLKKMAAIERAVVKSRMRNSVDMVRGEHHIYHSLYRESVARFVHHVAKDEIDRYW